jgi:hypothetical protein
LKWWFRKCFQFNSSQQWIWFKSDWWKWFTKWKTVWSDNFNMTSNFNYWWCRKMSNQFVMHNINQNVVFNNKDIIPWFNWNWW